MMPGCTTARKFSGWRLSELGEERRRLQHDLADAPPDVVRDKEETAGR